MKKILDFIKNIGSKMLYMLNGMMFGLFIGLMLAFVLYILGNNYCDSIGNKFELANRFNGQCELKVDGKWVTLDDVILVIKKEKE